MFFRDGSITQKLRFTIIASISASLFLAFSGFLVYDFFSVRNSLISELAVLSQILGDRATAALVFEDQDSARENLSALQEKESIVAAGIYSSDGCIFAQYVRNSQNPAPLPNHPREQGHFFHKGSLHFFTDIFLNQERIGSVYLRSSLNTTLIRVIRYALYAFILTVISFYCALLVSKRLQKQITDPIQNLAHTARAVSDSENYSVRAVKQSNDELGLFTETFNTMLGHIQARDSQLREAYRKQQAGEEKFKTLVANFPGAIYRCTDGESRPVEFISSQIEKICGYPAADFLNKEIPSYDHIIHPDDRTMVKKIVSQGISVKSPFFITYRVLHTDGTTHWVHERGQGIFDEGGALLWIDGAIVDVTERIQAQEEIRRMRNYLQNVINSMPSALIGIDKEGCITQLNYQAEQVTGVPFTEARGREVLSVFPQLEQQMEKINCAIREKTIQKSEKVPAEKDGESRYQDIMVYPLVANGVEGAVIRIDDVTARVRIEDMMIQAEKMLSVGGLAAGMAHEINNPLGGILQSVQNIMRRIAPEIQKNRAAARECGISLNALQAYFEKRGITAFLRGIQESGTRAAKIVDNMITFSRRSENTARPVDIPAVLEKSLDLACHDYDLKKMYDFRNIEIIREFEPDLPQALCIDAEIEQVLLYLLRNAAQAIFDQNPPNAAPRITLRCKKLNAKVRIEVADNGPGIRPDLAKRIFEPFFTTKEIGIGSGLGLSVSYFIITRKNKGSLNVVSEPGKGATIIIDLPAQKDRQTGNIHTESHRVCAPRDSRS